MRNPAFAIPRPDIRRDLARMRANPVPLARPLVVLGGWRTPRWTSARLARRLADLTSGNRDDALPVSFFWVWSIDAAVARAARAIADRFGPDAHIDAVGVSMGGIVGRALLDHPRLRIARLFTLASPHRGARLARIAAPDRAARCMRPGSPFLDNLDRRLASSPCELIPYARLRDAMVGATNTAPPGYRPLWKPGPPLLSHLTITQDDAILLDIARRLRNEPPIASPADPPPRD